MANRDSTPSGRPGSDRRPSDKKGPFNNSAYDKGPFGNRREDSKPFSGEGSKFKGRGEGKKVFNRSERFDRPAEEGKRFAAPKDRFAGDANPPFKSGPKFGKSRFGSSNERMGTGSGYQGRDRKDGGEDKSSRFKSKEDYRPASGEKGRERRPPATDSRSRFSDRGGDRPAIPGSYGKPDREGGKFGGDRPAREGSRFSGGKPDREGSRSGSRDRDNTGGEARSRYSDRPKRDGEESRGRYSRGEKGGSPRFGDRSSAPNRERPGDRYKGSGPEKGRYGNAPRREEAGGKRFDSRGDRPREDRGPRREGDAARETRFGAGRREGPRTSRAAEAPSYDLKRYEDRAQDKMKGKDREYVDPKDGKMRLNRYIANAGICSRREADELISAGEIKVNGEVVTEMGHMVGPEDTVQYGKKKLNREKSVYVLLNKPKDFITTTEDPEGRKTVMDLVATASKERIFPVGRLDRNTTGLLLFTNDGELAQKLSHPSHKNAKIYQVELDRPLADADYAKILEGVELEDGKAEVDELAIITPDKKMVGIEIHIGKNRIVRRVFEHLGYEVVGLDRVQYAGLTKKDLPRGKWRFLNEKEVIRLKYFM